MWVNANVFILAQMAKENTRILVDATPTVGSDGAVGVGAGEIQVQ